MASVKYICLLSLCCLLYGCSNTSVYNNLDWIAEWYIDDYIELNYQQESLLEDKLDALHLWHRQQELIKYRTQLVVLLQELENPPLSYQEILQQFALIESHWQRLRQQFSTEMATMAPLLSSVQVKALFKELEDKNQEILTQYHEQSASEFKQQRIEKIEQVLDKYLGSITEEQRLLVKVFVHNAYSMKEEYVNYSRQYLNALQLTFEQAQGKQLSEQIYTLMNDPDPYKNRQYQQQTKYNITLALDTLYSINVTLTTQQRGHLKNEIDKLIVLIDILTRT